MVEEEVEFLAEGIAGAALALIEEAGALFPDPTAAGVHRGDAAVVDSLALSFQSRYRSGRQRAHGR